MKRTQTTALAGLALLTGLTSHAWDLKLSENHTVQFHGFASQGYLKSSEYNYLGKTEDGSFEFTELGLNATYSPFARTRIAVQGFAFDVGNVGDLVPFLDYASIDYTFNDYVGVRAGRVRRPAGIYNHIQDVDLARTTILLPQGIYDARWRDFSTSIDGGVLYGNLSLGKAGDLSYEGYVGFMNISDEGGVARVVENGLPAFPNTGLDGFNRSLMVGGQLWWNTPLSGLRAGLSLGQVFDFSYDFHVFGGAMSSAYQDIPYRQLSLEYLWNSWTFQTEYYSYTAGASRPEAWYASAAYRFNKWFEAGAYYTEYFANARNRDAGGAPTAWQKDAALSLRFDATDWWIIKLEGHYIHGTALLNDNANNPPASQNRDGWFMLAAKTTFSF
jgi:hypothetical protein